MALPVRRGNDVAHVDDSNRPARWDPFAELDQLNRRLGSLLESWRNLPDLLGDAFTPLADVEETDDAYLVEIELPGVRRDDVDIEIAGRRLSVRGERKEKQRTGILRRRERVLGRFGYEVTMPGEVDEGGVEAHLGDGVLTVRLPKPEHERPRRIPVH